ncbi:MAG: rhomboid family intramembrane serine protease [Omnitrophica WOR_2 bacterium]
MNQDFPPRDPQQPPEPPEYNPSPANPAPRRVSIRLPGVSPVVSYTLLGITVFVFLLQTASTYLFNGMDWPAVLGMKVNTLIEQGQFWRLITPMFLHGGLLHIGFNMYALYLFGPGLERHYGHGRFLLLYLLSGFTGNVMSFLFAAAPSLGASTAIFGLLGAEGVFLYQNRQIFGENAQRALMNIVLIAGINLFIGGVSQGIDNWGHVGGLLGGTLFAWTAGPLLHVEGIFPNLTVVDNREGGDTLRASLGVGLLFTLLAAATIFLRRG